MLVFALVFGVAMVMPIGGADIPVVISLSNSFTGLAGRGGRLHHQQRFDDRGRNTGRFVRHIADAAHVPGHEPAGNQRSVRRVGSGGVARGGGRRHCGKNRQTHSGRRSRALARLRPAGCHRARLRHGCGAGEHQVRELSDELGKRGVEVRFAIRAVAGRCPAT